MQEANLFYFRVKIVCYFRFDRRKEKEIYDRCGFLRILGSLEVEKENLKWENVEKFVFCRIYKLFF